MVSKRSRCRATRVQVGRTRSFSSLLTRGSNFRGKPGQGSPFFLTAQFPRARSLDGSHVALHSVPRRGLARSDRRCDGKAPHRLRMGTFHSLPGALANLGPPLTLSRRTAAFEATCRCLDDRLCEARGQAPHHEREQCVSRDRIPGSHGQQRGRRNSNEVRQSACSRSFLSRRPAD